MYSGSVMFKRTGAESWSAQFALIDLKRLGGLRRTERSRHLEKDSMCQDIYSVRDIGSAL